MHHRACIKLEGFLGGLSGKESAFQTGGTGDPSLNTETARSPGVGNGSPFQHPSLENSVGRAAWWATAQGARQSDTTEQLTFNNR